MKGRRRAVQLSFVIRDESILSPASLQFCRTIIQLITQIRLSDSVNIKKRAFSGGEAGNDSNFEAFWLLFALRSSVFSTPELIIDERLSETPVEPSSLGGGYLKASLKVHFEVK